MDDQCDQNYNSSDSGQSCITVYEQNGAAKSPTKTSGSGAHINADLVARLTKLLPSSDTRMAHSGASDTNLAHSDTDAETVIDTNSRFASTFGGQKSYSSLVSVDSDHSCENFHLSTLLDLNQRKSNSSKNFNRTIEDFPGQIHMPFSHPSTDSLSTYSLPPPDTEELDSTSRFRDFYLANVNDSHDSKENEIDKMASCSTKDTEVEETDASAFLPTPIILVSSATPTATPEKKSNRGFTKVANRFHQVLTQSVSKAYKEKASIAQGQVDQNMSLCNLGDSGCFSVPESPVHVYDESVSELKGLEDMTASCSKGTEISFEEFHINDETSKLKRDPCPLCLSESYEKKTPLEFNAACSSTVICPLCSTPVSPLSLEEQSVASQDEESTYEESMFKTGVFWRGVSKESSSKVGISNRGVSYERMSEKDMSKEDKT